jgi:peroxiredoxin
MLKQDQTAPDFRLPDVHGAETTLEAILSRGKVLLAFFKVSCPVCHLTLPFLERLHESSRLQIIGVSQDDAESTREFCRQLHLTFPMLLDDPDANYPVSQAFGIANVPSLFLVKKDSGIEWSVSGFSRKALEDLGHDLHVAVFRADDRVPDFKPG